ncbi:relaxase [Pseudoflavonifractor sp. 524-17]|uniref:relaxase/mobilization nuclease domain-containing protein n=1 Tax=Pseudoflavonifractor sp. 524-17 TaxID=2304577 RepID=UPI00137962B6|nr:relaxase/mobilization nuclease domain-containing protein [Pseudoflavonifractor sp. 524-17]NCE66472.1 relaxase [Pseudoflavonifractor sp. 524-17]
MATTRIMSLHTGKGRTVAKAINDIIDYVENPDKTDGGRLISSYQCDSRIADAEFLFAKRQYLARTGRKRGADDVIAYTIRQSFVPGEITPEEANRLGYELARRFTKGKHAFIVCTHVDKAHIHNHIIWNSTTLDHSWKFRDFLGSRRAVRRLNDTICVQNGYSIVENSKRRGKSYNKWLGSKPPCHRDRLRMAIDAALAQKPANLDALLQLLRNAGIEVSPRGKSIRLKAPGGKQFVRLDGDSMGADYSILSLLAILAGEKQHTPLSKNIRRADPPKVNLLVDIQAKLQAGKGAGYARWAKTFNLKQMAQTLNYLTEHDLLDYADLTAKTDEATGRYQELSARIKASEQRMAEIAVLKTHIINYAKTREVYVAYRKAGYSKKFKAEHESDILLHQAAKKFFDESGLKKLPTVRSLQAEYAALLAEKKAAYADFRKAREDMKELLTVRANVQKLMGYEAQGQEKEADRREEER